MKSTLGVRRPRGEKSRLRQRRKGTREIRKRGRTTRMFRGFKKNKMAPFSEKRPGKITGVLIKGKAGGEKLMKTKKRVRG